MKILGIDDEVTIIESLKFAFESKGHEFVMAYNGKDGIKLMMEQKFDAVLLDYQMPEFTGTVRYPNSNG